MSDMAREIIYPTFVVVLIASVWALGWEKSHTDRLEDYRPRVTKYDDGYSPYADEEIADEQQLPASVTSTFDPADE